MGPRMQGLVLMTSFLGRGRSRPASILLAVGWGTLSMMLLLAFGEGLKIQLNTGKTGLGPEPIVCWPGTTTRPWNGMKAGRAIRFAEEDLIALRNEVPEINELGAERGQWGVTLTWGESTISAHLTGVTPNFETIRSHHAQRGSRFLNEVDQQKARRVLFLGPQLKERLFGDADAIGQTVAVRGTPFTVVGIMIDKMQMGMYGGPDVDKACIPLSTYEVIFGQAPYDDIVYTIRPGHASTEAERKVREVIARRQRFDAEDAAAIYFRDEAANRKELDQVTVGIQVFLGMIGAMTLLVAGVGLANMLFVMVHRRIREIGMQMAIGAQRAVVTARIVGESLILASLGGYLGIGLAWLIVELLQRVPVENEGLQFLGKPTLSIPLGIVTVVVLMGIGCLAGSLPARRAARLNPVEALRHE